MSFVDKAEDNIQAIRNRGKEKLEVWEDKWIHTQCHRCMCDCALLVHRVNGVAVEITGDPDSECGSYGGLCPKSASGLQVLYDPNRLNYPMKRTNFEKGIGVDPKWQRISWEEALSTIAEKLQEARDINPDRIVIQHGILNGTQIGPMFGFPMVDGLSNEKGKPFHFNAGGGQCGSALHFMTFINYGCFIIHEDFSRCKYAIIWGTNIGAGGMQQFRNRMAAEARVNGTKIVVFDPMCNGNASMASEWIPLKPGTDAAVALGMLNEIVNVLHMIDEPRLKKKTDCVYLVKEDGRFLRDNDRHDPMIWDPVDGCAKVFDDPTIKDYALYGYYEVNGQKVCPSFEKLKDRFAEYPAEKVEKISDVPAETIRRIAREFAEAANIGGTCEIDGEVLPLRPVLSLANRAPGTHKNGLHAQLATDLLNHVVGAGNCPGSIVCMASECDGFETTGQPRYYVEKSTDGYLKMAGKTLFPPHFYPPPKPEWPTVDLESVYPLSLEMPTPSVEDFFEIQKAFGLRTDWDVLINYASNGVMNGANPLARERFYKACKFVVDIDIYSTEFNEAFADIVLPDKCYLEINNFQGIHHSYHNQPGIPGLDWCFHITQSVVPQQYERKEIPEIMLLLFRKMGMADTIRKIYNDAFLLTGTPYEFTEKDNNFTVIQLCDHAVRRYAGDEYTWEWFCEHGSVRKPKTVKEAYWACFKDIRVHCYHEYFLDVCDEFKKIMEKAGLADQIYFDAYDPCLTWFPIGVTEDPECDLFAFSWMDVTQIGTNGQEQPWIDEVARSNPYTYYVNLHPDTAARKGLKDGDIVEVISSDGLSATGMLAIRKGIRPDCLAIMGNAGHFAKGMPTAKGKGIHYNAINACHFRDLDPITGTLEVANKVKIRKIN